MWCKYIKQKSQPFVIQTIAIYFVPLKDEILNLWDDFRCIVEYLQCVEGVIKLINSI